MNLSLKEFIIIHTAYRHIFHAPVRIEDCKKWLHKIQQKTYAFDESVQALDQEGLISQEDGYLCIKGHEHIIAEQPKKDRLTKILISKGKSSLNILSKLPFIKYIGISGSVAANNPVGSIDDKDRGFVDLDLFVICRANCLWILFLIERIIKNIRSLLRKNNFYCFNYATDENFLEIFNKNFYTATEITNLKTVYDDDVYSSFIQENRWFEKYYPNSVNDDNGDKQYENGISWTFLMAPLNFMFFTIFCLGRAIKRRELSPLLEIFGGFNPIQKCNLMRISNPNGGFQEAIKNRFLKIYQEQFPGYFNEAIMEELFPQANAFNFSPEDNIHDKEHATMFAKYAKN